MAALRGGALFALVALPCALGFLSPHAAIHGLAPASCRVACAVAPCGRRRGLGTRPALAMSTEAGPAGGVGSGAGEARAEFLRLAGACPRNGVGTPDAQAAEVHAAIEALTACNAVAEPAYELLKPPYTYFDGTYEL
jgi:hypothetical protein